MTRGGLAAVAMLALGACTWLFNPDNVKVRNCEALPSPAPLDAIAGDHTGLTFEWANERGGDGGSFKDWQLCWGNSETSLGTCRTFTNTGCEGATCTFAVDGVDAGFAYNRRVWAQVVSRDKCGKQSEPARTSATPINGTFADFTGIELSTECDAGAAVAGGMLSVAQMPTGFNNCISALSMGDDGWKDSTIDVEVRAFATTYAGIVFHYPTGAGATGPRQAAVLTPAPGAIYTLMLTRKVTTDLPVASAIPVLQDGVWYALRVITSGSNVSVAVAPVGSPPQEVLRWRNASTTATPDGRLGLALVSILGQPSRADLRNLRARTGSSVPDGGATSLSLTFGGGGGGTDKIRLVPQGDPPRARFVQCPNGFGAGCATCAPAPGSQCLELNAGLLTNASATFDVPVGIDFDRPWSLKFKFAPVLLDNPNEPIIVRATAGDFATRPIISGTGANWNMLKGFENDALGSINRSEWNRFELVFDTKKGLYSVAINGHAALDGGVIPTTLDPHLGAFVFGGDGFHGEHGFWTDVEISQP